MAPQAPCSTSVDRGSPPHPPKAHPSLPPAFSGTQLLMGSERFRFKILLCQLSRHVTLDKSVNLSRDSTFSFVRFNDVIHRKRSVEELTPKHSKPSCSYYSHHVINRSVLAVSPYSQANLLPVFPTLLILNQPYAVARAVRTT